MAINLLVRSFSRLCVRAGSVQTFTLPSLSNFYAVASETVNGTNDRHLACVHGARCVRKHQTHDVSISLTRVWESDAMTMLRLRKTRNRWFRTHNNPIQCTWSFSRSETHLFLAIFLTIASAVVLRLRKNLNRTIFSFVRKIERTAVRVPLTIADASMKFLRYHVARDWFLWTKSKHDFHWTHFWWICIRCIPVKVDFPSFLRTCVRSLSIRDFLVLQLGCLQFRVGNCLEKWIHRFEFVMKLFRLRQEHTNFPRQTTTNIRSIIMCGQFSINRTNTIQMLCDVRANEVK